ncbi:MAG: LysM peptidoglycan-binding domain-containing protein [Anaerolineae bacterium]|nr:LysM peptidoglycan-binding domain-containing protein [Anaerolineae bacterium]
MHRPSRLILLIISILMFTLAFSAFAQDDNPSQYTVERGDILDSIAARFDVQTSCLAAANDLGAGNEIKPGQQLVIDYSCPRYDGLDFVTNPREDDSGGSVAGSGDLGQGGGDSAPEPGPNDTTYTVTRGDTLDTIGQELNISSVAIAVANEIGPRDIIEIGQVLIIPADAPAYGQFPALTVPQNLNSTDQELGQGGGGVSAGPGDILYIVQPLDILDRIASGNNVQALCLSDANNLTNPSRIFPGQTLVIPSSCPPYDGADIIVDSSDAG